MQNNKWKRISSGILAVCLIATLLLSNQSFGVFAEEDGSQTSVQDTQSDETNQDEQPLVEKNNPSKENDAETTEQPTEDSAENEISTDDNKTEEKNEDISTFSESKAVNTWQHEVKNITVAGSGSDPGTIDVTSGNNEKNYTGNNTVVFDYNISSSNTTSGELTFIISDVGIMSDDGSLEIWHIKDSSAERVTTGVQKSEGKVQFTAAELGEYIAVSNVVTVDLAKSTETTSITVGKDTIVKTGVNITNDAIEGNRQDGTSVKISFSEDKKYRIAQSTQERIKKAIWFSGEFATNRNIIIDGINTSDSLDVSAKTGKKLVSLQLRNKNQIHHIGYGYDNNNHSSQLIIENYGTPGNTSGELYVPYEMNTKTEEQNYILSNGGSTYWAYAGIGGNQEVGSNTSGLTIAGGTIKVITRNVDGSTAIGGGGNGLAQLSITGGNITAICSSTGTAIGGGIGWLYQGGMADISITGGTIYAENIKYRSATANRPASDGRPAVTLGEIQFGGVAIGSGSSVVDVGRAAKIYIGGNSQVKAYARYGNGIGSGNSYNGTAAEADITIDGNSSVTTNALGGGTSKKGQGGSANIAVKDKALVNCVKYSEIANKWDLDNKNELGAFGIGGGNSAGDAKGGSAVVNVSGGTLNCNGGNIGGGDATGIGAGGDASINISGGTLDCASIGGGNSASGTPGAVTGSDNQKAGVVVSGGTLRTGTIGGGKNNKDDIGFATADISGGNIQGQFILSNTDADKKCTFTMTGGTIDNSGLVDNSSYQKGPENGGAVYLSDSNGEVNISGGTIKNSNAKLGGAIYMTNGSFELSGTGIIYDCQATKGGAVYLTNGTVNVSGGSIGAVIDNQEHPNQAEDGAGVYMAGGNMMVSGGKIIANKATQNGGGAYLSSGNMTVTGGQISNNTAINGAGSYLESGQLNISGGNIESNIATENGGGFYLAGGELYISEGTITSNTAQNGAGSYVADSKVRMFGGSFENNTATENGGGIYVSSEKKAADVVIRSGQLTGNSAGKTDTTSSQGNGGAIAVVSSNSSNADQVIIGVREVHNDLDKNTRKLITSFKYTDDKDKDSDGNAIKHEHAACPEITGNKATGNGGGIYMSSSESVLNIYCLLENNNTATADATGGSIMSVGGNVNIGDINEKGEGTNSESAKGNIWIQSPMLVKGGNIRICGNTENPKFTKEILVNIQKTTEGTSGTFTDERQTTVGANKSYLIEYFENFEGSGAYKSLQYADGTEIRADGSLFKHVGYKIVGWDTKQDAKDATYKAGETIGSTEEGYKAWSEEGTLKLYAIWKKTSYTVTYNPGSDDATGQMDSDTFEYGVIKALQKNTFKVTGKRFVNWKTEDGETINGDYNKADLTEEDSVTVSLTAQWRDCTHDPEKESEDSDILSYELNSAQTIITEKCNCGGHTATVEISGADAYSDGKSHPAILKYSSTKLIVAKPLITYQYKADKNADYGSMPEGTSEPVNVGYYKASITVKGKTALVTYQIKSPAEAATIDVTTQKGQHFDAPTGQKKCTVSQDDAFTIRFNVQGLNKGTNAGANEKAYSTAPILILNQELPSRTTIIMQVVTSSGSSYWYNNAPKGTEIALNSFAKMGSENNDSNYFQYYEESAIPDAQDYRFIIDFSDVENQLSVDSSVLEVGLKYEYGNSNTGNTGSNQDKEEKAAITIAKKASFNIIVSSEKNSCTVAAPSDVTDTRWAHKNLIWKITTADTSEKLPADAKITMTTNENGQTRTSTYSLNEEGEYVIPFAWTGNQKFTFELSSQQEAVSGKSYALKAALCVGNYINETNRPAALEDNQEQVSKSIELVVPTKNESALKISGVDNNERVLSASDTLKINVSYENGNLNKYSIKAIIQKEKDKGFVGNLSEQSIKNQTEKHKECNFSFSMQTMQGAGNYRVWVTVSKVIDNEHEQIVLQVPYYFIVQ